MRDQVLELSGLRAAQVSVELVQRTAKNRRHPFDDIDWDADHHVISPTDERWLTGFTDPSAGSEWFSGLSREDQCRFALERICVFLLVGVEFEGGLCGGLLQYAHRFDAGSPQFRYAYEEIIEETQHSLMFRSFVERGAPDLLQAAREGLGGEGEVGSAAIGRRVAEFASSAPMLFLCGALCGEEPIDHVQRAYLAEPEEQCHPLLRSICALHVAEEARHLRFARAELRDRIERSTPREVSKAKFFLPLAVDRMTKFMLGTPDWFAARWAIPQGEIDGTLWREREERYRAESATKILAFARSAGLN